MGELVTLCMVAIPVACASWTITKEEIFREFREWCKCSSDKAAGIKNRMLKWTVCKAMYLPRCYYCTSFYTTEFFLLLTGVKFVSPGWRGAVMAWFAIVFISQVYLTVFNLMRVALRHYQAVADLAEHRTKETVGEKETAVIKMVA